MKSKGPRHSLVSSSAWGCGDFAGGAAHQQELACCSSDEERKEQEEKGLLRPIVGSVRLRRGGKDEKESLEGVLYADRFDLITPMHVLLRRGYARAWNTRGCEDPRRE